VLAALGEVVWSELVVVSVECAIDGAVVSVEFAIDGAVVSVECAIDGAVVCALDDALSLFLFLLLEVNFVDILVVVGAVAGDII
jgi:hypothetical protein